MKHFYLLLFIIFPIISFSQTSEKCNFEITCENKFKLEFKSKSGNCADDDTSIQFNHENTSNPLSITPAWFYEMENIGNIESTCKSTHYQSYPIFIKNDQALIFIRKNNRPGYDLILAILINSKSGKVLDNVELGQYMRSTFGLVKYKAGYKMRMVSGSNKDMRCDCDASFDEGWLEVKIEKNKIKKNWINHKDLN